MIAATRGIGTMALATVREALRERGFHGLVAMVCLCILAAIALGELSVGQQMRVVIDVGLAATRLGGLCAALFLGAGVVAREIERRSAAATLTAPLARWVWLVGRFGGVVLALLVLVTTAGLVLAAVAAALMTLGLAPQAPVASLSDLSLRLSAALLLVLVELTMVAAVATMFSAFSSHLLALGCALGVWVAGHYAPLAVHLATSATSVWVAGINRLLWYVLPNVTMFGAAPGIAHGEPVSGVDLALGTAYGMVYAAAMLAMGCVLFARRDV